MFCETCLLPIEVKGQHRQRRHGGNPETAPHAPERVLESGWAVVNKGIDSQCGCGASGGRSAPDSTCFLGPLIPRAGLRALSPGLKEFAIHRFGDICGNEGHGPFPIPRAVTVCRGAEEIPLPDVAFFPLFHVWSCEDAFAGVASNGSNLSYHVKRGHLCADAAAPEELPPRPLTPGPVAALEETLPAGEGAKSRACSPLCSNITRF